MEEYRGTLPVNESVPEEEILPGEKTVSEAEVEFQLLSHRIAERDIADVEILPRHVHPSSISSPANIR